jgi:NO-binding membrane sensor protein with MHYT domain
MRPRHYLQTALFIGLGISTMHYVGMAALQTSAQQHYQTALLLASIAIAVATSLVALLMARHFRQAAAPGTC